MSHYEETGEEIVNAFNLGDLNACVIGVGTGGTIVGVAQKIKEKMPNCKVIFNLKNL